MKFFNNLKVGTKIIFGFLIILTLMVGMGTTLLFSLDNLKKGFVFLVEHDQPVLSNAHELAKLVVDMETGERGFLITGKEEFLEPYNIGIQAFDSLLKIEKQLVSDNPSQVNILKKIEQLHYEWIKQAGEPEIAKRREAKKNTVSAEHLQEILKAGVGKNILDKLRAVLSQLETNLRAKNDLESVILTIKIAKNMVDQETGERGFIITGVDSFLEPYYAGHKQLEINLAALQSRLTVADDLKLLEQVKSLSKQWIEQAAKPEIAARRSMNTNSVTMNDIIKMIQIGTGKKILDELRVQFKYFIQIEKQLNIERSSVAKLNVSFVNNLTLWLTVISMIIGLSLAVFISRNITVPLQKLTIMTNNMAIGNIRQIISLQNEINEITIRKDEMGDIGNAYNTLATYFKEIIEDIVSVSDGLKNGDLQVSPKTQYKGDFVKIKDSLESISFNLLAVVKDIVQTSQGLADGNLRTTTKAEYKGDFVQIKDSMETALFSLNKMVKDTVQVSQGLADGNLRITPKAKYKGDFVNIKNALETALLAQSQVIEDIVQVSQGLADGSKNVVAKADYQGDFIQIKTALEAAANKLSESMAKNTIQDWLKTGQTELSKKISGELEIIDLAKNICDFLTTYLEAQVGAFYIVEEETRIKLIASYAYNQRKGLPNEFQLGEGLVGQAVLEKQKILVTDVPEDYISIQSGIGEAVPKNILVMPFMYENSVKGAIEIGSFHEFTSTQLELLEQVMPNIGITMNTAESRTKMQALLQSEN
ncbi:CHASE3 domain-containing protein [Candidatus Halobeggiatoa sp. HSG11]|nr:CHASE3 domain-containing protein [Candidatus Halobeggiatoa sp. HSG11]